MLLEETLKKIKSLDKSAMKSASKRWDSIAKPLHSLGKMEDLVIQIAGIEGTADVSIVNTGVAVAVTVTNDPVHTKTTVSEIVLPSYERMDSTYVIKCY